MSFGNSIVEVGGHLPVSIKSRVEGTVLPVTGQCEVGLICETGRRVACSDNLAICLDSQRIRMIEGSEVCGHPSVAVEGGIEVPRSGRSQAREGNYAG